MVNVVNVADMVISDKVEEKVKDVYKEHLEIAGLMNEIMLIDYTLAENVRTVYKKLQDIMHCSEMGDAFGSGDIKELVKYHSFSDTVGLYNEWLEERMKSLTEALRDEMEDN